MARLSFMDLDHDQGPKPFLPLFDEMDWPSISTRTSENEVIFCNGTELVIIQLPYGYAENISLIGNSNF